MCASQTGETNCSSVPFVIGRTVGSPALNNPRLFKNQSGLKFVERLRLANSMGKLCAKIQSSCFVIGPEDSVAWGLCCQW